jgi:poly-gamma-glutamate synthesis protein (capsule biosynthesis protein)
VLVFSLAAVSSGTPQAWAATADRPGVNLIALTENDVGCLQRYVASIKRPGDIVVASIHWGGNFSHQLEPKQQNFAKALIDRAGIDLIHGHSSHHVSAIEVYNGKLILFGCGDLINDYEGIPKSPERQSLRPDLGLIYCIRLNAETGRLASLRMRPMQMRQMRVQRADESDAAWLCAALNRGSAASGAHFMAERGVLTIDFG